MDIKTKTICTIGPSSSDEKIIEQLILKGMDIARLNFSHSSCEQYLKIKNLIEKYNKKHKKNVKILMDLQGPRMRVGILPANGIKLTEGQEITFSTNNEADYTIFIDDPYLHLNIEVGHPIFLSNGDMELMVVGKKGNSIKTRVIRGGILYSKKGVNFPETNLTTSGLTGKDIKDLEFGVKNCVDFIALSFVKNADDVNFAKKLIGNCATKLISKIERKQAIVNLDKIIDATDLIMVARGDLGIEMPLEELPILQKKIIKDSKNKNKPCIVATQMLESMVNHYRPTRAEVTDVANAVLEGAWGLMLSDETAFGKYPLESLDYLVKVISKTEKFLGSN
ncbi:MAG: pyruvate kinase [Actinobacteria bacterium]|nr:pyruvate kinase [Actinomycetota bacterium]